MSRVNQPKSSHGSERSEDTNASQSGKSLGLMCLNSARMKGLSKTDEPETPGTDRHPGLVMERAICYSSSLIGVGSSSTDTGRPLGSSSCSFGSTPSTL